VCVVTVLCRHVLSRAPQVVVTAIETFARELKKPDTAEKFVDKVMLLLCGDSHSDHDR
jgi:hypothetical protein